MRKLLGPVLVDFPRLRSPASPHEGVSESQVGEPSLPTRGSRAIIGHSSPQVVESFPPKLSVRQTLESAWAEDPRRTPQLDYNCDRRVSACLRSFEAELRADTAHGTTTAGRKESDTDPLQHKPTKTSDHDLEVQEYLTDVLDWADGIRFGDLPRSAQQIAIYLRAIIGKPDLIILEDSFGDIEDHLRQKCVRLLFDGITHQPKRSSTPSKRKQGHPVHNDAMILPALSPDQALVCYTPESSRTPVWVEDWIFLLEHDNTVRPCFRHWGRGSNTQRLASFVKETYRDFPTSSGGEAR